MHATGDPWFFTLQRRSCEPPGTYLATLRNADRGLLFGGCGDTAAEAVRDLLERPGCPRELVRRALGRIE